MGHSTPDLEAAGRILVVDDDPDFCQLLELQLTRAGYPVRWAISGGAALASLAAEDTDVVLADLRMPDMSGLELCRRIAAERPGLPVVVMTAYGSLEAAVDAIRAGAFDFVTKPIDAAALAAALARALERARLTSEVRRLHEDDGGEDAYEILGKSPAMVRVRELVRRAAAAESSVLVTGETGTGKELIARALHRNGPRGGAAFVTVNCSAVPEALFESELFGHVRGAFTDARTDRDGQVREASGGTLFLDEIGELPRALQPKLLRVLQEKRVRPLGGDAEIPVDVRLVAATNRDIDDEVKRGTFREDLYFRLNVIRIDLPPLRARGNDVLLLAQRFLRAAVKGTGRDVPGLTPDAAARLLSYDWPGNVRELQNCVERAVAMSERPLVEVEDLPDAIRLQRRVSVRTEDDASRFSTLEEMERRYILRVVDALKGERTKVARVLGIDRKTLLRKLDRYRGDEPES